MSNKTCCNKSDSGLIACTSNLTKDRLKRARRFTSKIFKMRRLEFVFNKYGRFLARHPLPFLILPIIITLTSCVGLLNFHSQDDIWDIYSPLNALSRVEEAAQHDFEYIAANHHYRIQVLVDRKDGGSLMNAESMQEIGAVNKFITDNVTATNGKRSFAYREFCGIYCNDSNSFVIGFVQAAIQKPSNALLNFQLSYPTGQALNTPLFLGYSIGNVETKKQDKNDILTSFKLFVLHYMIDLNLPNGRELRDDFEQKLMSLFDAATEESEILNFAVLSRNRELHEQRKITITALPFLGLTGAVLTAFMLITLLDDPLYKSQCIEALFGVISPGMALITTFGLVWGAGLPFSNILTVVPFLVITIGIDDAFLILAGWRQSNPNGSLEDRMGESLAKSGASVSVTSITDVLCFGVGIISNMPVVQLFCVYTSIALAIDFLYQITFFTAIVAYCGKRQIMLDEAHRESAESSPNGSISSRGSWRRHLLRKAESIKGIFTVQQIHPTNELKVAEILTESPSDYLSCFVAFLHSWFGQIFILSTFIAHIIISIYLCTFVNTNFDMENLYLKESPLTPISRKMQNFMLKESFVVNFVMQPMGSLQDEKRRQLFHQMIDELENIPFYGMGNKGSNLWTRDYEATAQFWAQEDEDMWAPIPLYNNYKLFALDARNIHTSQNQNGSTIIDAFTWHITYHNMSNFIDVEDLLVQRRAILSKYSKYFSVTSHHPLEKVPTESAASAPYNFIQTSVSAIVLMSILVFFFIMDAEAIFSVVLSILSISCGTVGYLHLWGVNLDAVSLISMLMSIGFSVDYSAHICYHYYTHNDEDSPPVKSPLKIKPTRITIDSDSIQQNGEKLPAKYVDSIVNNSSEQDYAKSETYERIYHTFQGVGWPVIQSGLSTVIGMIPLLFVDAYCVAVFYKTIILVTFLGMYHALFLLPTLFIRFSAIRSGCRCSSN